MANKMCDIGVDSIGKQSTLTLGGAGTTVSRGLRVAWDDGSRRDEVLGCLLTIEEAMEARLRAENRCAANS